MKYINGLDSERADATCPENEKVLWTCLRGFSKINVVTLCTSKDSCIRLYTESGGIMDMPFSGYVRRNCDRSDADRETEMLEEIVNRDAVVDEMGGLQMTCNDIIIVSAIVVSLVIGFGLAFVGTKGGR